nr:MAG TPA: Baseplate wedge protein [Caudoviricetes sp.]
MIEIATDCELIGQVTTQGKILGTMIGQSGPPGPAGPKGDTGNVKFENLTTEQKEELRGEDGYTPQKGIDYFTESEVEEIKANLLAETNGNIKKIEEKLHEKDETLNTENKLIKEQIPGSSESGNSVHIEDSGTLDFDWKINGNQYQATREGYNFLKVEKETTTADGITFTVNQDGSITCKGTATATVTLYFKSANNSIYPKQLKTGTYKLSGGTTNIMLGCQIGSVYYNTNSARTIELTEQSSISNAYIQIASGKTVNNETIYPLLYEYNGTDKPYEQYGASPSPGFSSEIETVSGSVEIDVVNSNLLDFNVAQDSRVTVNKDGTLTINGAGGFGLNIDKLQLKAGITYYQKVELISGSISGSNIDNTFLSFVGAGKWISSKIFTGSSFNEDTEKTTIWINASAIFDNAVIKIWANTDNSDFVKHQSQTAIMPIQQEMLSGDYVADVEHHEWKKTVFTGNESWNLDDSVGNIRQYSTVLSVSSQYSENNISVISNCFRGVTFELSWLQDNSITILSNSVVLRIMTSNYTTVEDFKTWLKSKYEAGAPVTVYYKLATPINLELTEEQKAVRNQKLYTYKNITNIDVSDELANIDVEYRKNLKVNNFTDEDRSKLIPPGGAAGQVLAKNTDTDNDVKWVDQAGGTTGDTLPVGSVISYIKAIAPENWLVCDGSAVSRTDYSELFNVIGTTFGTGDGSTTFNLPDIKGKTIVGLDSSDTDFNEIGKTLGEKTHTLTVAEMPSHNHSMGSFNQYNDGTGGSFAESEKVGRTTSGADGSKSINPIFNTGGSKAHNNIQPSVILCYIIKAK